MIAREEAIKWIKTIQGGDGIDRTRFPESMKGLCAVQVWDRPEFTLGIEYGVIIGLMETFEIKAEELRA